jgi:hypothetical protein
VNGLREFLLVERKRIPGEILFEADRLECQLFAGYDPNFDGDEPPGLSVLRGKVDQPFATREELSLIAAKTRDLLLPGWTPRLVAARVAAVCLR